MTHFLVLDFILDHPMDIFDRNHTLQVILSLNKKQFL